MSSDGSPPIIKLNPHVCCSNCGTTYSSRFTFTGQEKYFLQIAEHDEPCPKCGRDNKFDEVLINAERGLKAINYSDLPKDQRDRVEELIRTAATSNIPKEVLVTQLEGINSKVADALKDAVSKLPLWKIYGLIVLLGMMNSCSWSPNDISDLLSKAQPIEVIHKFDPETLDRIEKIVAVPSKLRPIEIRLSGEVNASSKIRQVELLIPNDSVQSSVPVPPADIQPEKQGGATP